MIHYCIDTLLFAMSQLIALTFDPFRYKFIQNKKDHIGELETYKKLSNKIF